MSSNSRSTHTHTFNQNHTALSRRDWFTSVGSDCSLIFIIWMYFSPKAKITFYIVCLVHLGKCSLVSHAEGSEMRLKCFINNMCLLLGEENLVCEDFVCLSFTVTSLLITYNGLRLCHNLSQVWIYKLQSWWSAQNSGTEALHNLLYEPLTWKAQWSNHISGLEIKQKKHTWACTHVRNTFLYFIPFFKEASI